MAKAALIQFSALFLFVFSAQGQKVKYKDIFGLLSTKQYEAAEPFLKSYLRENDDNPNAYLYMGIIFHEKSGKDDVLKQTQKAIADMDSAIFFYDKAYKMITEKEIKRNDEYYQSYNRRDLRTGEFGVKLSDIQFDLEKKMESLRERIDRVKMVRYYFTLSDSLYKKTTAMFRTIQDAYPGKKEFLLRADDTTLIQLAALVVRFDSCLKAFEHYKSSTATIGKTGYNQSISLRDIYDFKKDGTTPADFFQDDLQLWNYKKFAEESTAAIQKEIMPMREHLITYDIEINKLREKLNRDSVSVRSDLTKLIEKLLMEQLKKYDPEPLPMDVFSLKISDLEYKSALLEHKPFRDSSDVHLQLRLINKELKYLNRLDSLADKLTNTDLDKRAIDYSFFVTNTYSNITVLKSFVKAVSEYAERENRIRQELLSRRTEALRWVISGADSIPLFMGHERSSFKPLLVVEEKYTAGLHYTDSLNAEGYLYSITPSRKPDIKVTFPVDKPGFRLSRLPSVKTLSFTDAYGQIYFVLMYSEKPNKDNKYPATLAKIYRSDGLAWSSNLSLSFLPKEIAFKPDTGELTLKSDAQQNIVDKNGKLVK